jgi:hypothetical protein
MTGFGEVVLGASDTLFDNILWFDMKTLVAAYNATVINAPDNKDDECSCAVSQNIEDYFLRQKNIAPFSVDSLLTLCFGNTLPDNDPYRYTEEYWNGDINYCWEYRCQNRCADFAYTYMDNILSLAASKPAKMAISDKCNKILEKGHTDYKWIIHHKDTTKWKYEINDTQHIEGESVCSSVGGILGQKGTPDSTGNIKYCWCKLTKSISECPEISDDWVFAENLRNSDNCVRSCRSICAENFDWNQGFRHAMFSHAE